jgi:hypothetical protein
MCIKRHKTDPLQTRKRSRAKSKKSVDYRKEIKRQVQIKYKKEHPKIPRTPDWTEIE